MLKGRTNVQQHIANTDTKKPQKAYTDRQTTNIDIHASHKDTDGARTDTNKTETGTNIYMSSKYFI